MNTERDLKLFFGVVSLTSNFILARALPFGNGRSLRIKILRSFLANSQFLNLVRYPKHRYTFSFLFIISTLSAIEENINCRGKFDIGPAYVHVDFLESGKTFHKMDLAAVRADLNVRVWSGLIIRTPILYGQGNMQ